MIGSPGWCYENGVVRVTVVNCGSKKVGDIARLLARHGARPEIVPLRAAGAGELGDAVVVSGGPRLFTKERRLIDRFAFLDDLAQPILGICLGHQALGMRDGARVYLGEPRRDVERLEIEVAHPLFDGLGPSPAFREDHCEGIDLPDGWRLLASSEAYPVEAMVHDTRPRCGVQFHPEVSGETGERFLRNFLDWTAARGATAQGAIPS
jgi:GMP synthase-like glutamine amidotransferase